MVKGQKCKKTCQEDCQDTACKIQQRIFEREVDDELRQEKLANFWKKYRVVIIGAAIAVILGTVASELYHSWIVKTRLSESDRYETAIIASVQGRQDEAIEGLQKLANDGKTGYRYLAQLEMAGILFQQNQIEKAIDVLKEVAHNNSAPKPLSQAATLAFVGHQIGIANATELQNELLPIVGNTHSPFNETAIELSILLNIVSGEKDLATNKIKELLKRETLSPAIRERLTTILVDIEK